MNNVRRNKIRGINFSLKELVNDLQSVLDDEQDYFDNIPENLQYSQRAMDSEEVIDLMEQVIESLEDAMENLDMIQ